MGKEEVQRLWRSFVEISNKDGIIDQLNLLLDLCKRMYKLKEEMIIKVNNGDDELNQNIANICSQEIIKRIDYMKKIRNNKSASMWENVWNKKRTINLNNRELIGLFDLALN